MKQFQTKLLTKNIGWEIQKLDSARNIKYYPCCEEPYADIEFNFTIYRTSELRKTLVIIPITYGKHHMKRVSFTADHFQLC